MKKPLEILIVGLFAVSLPAGAARAERAHKSADPPRKRTPGKDGMKNAFAKGVVVGRVKAKGKAWIEVTSVSGQTDRYIPEWQGGAPGRSGGPNKKVVAQIARLKVGDGVVIKWYVNDHLRIYSVSRLGEARKDEAGGEKPKEESAKLEGSVAKTAGSGTGELRKIVAKLRERLEKMERELKELRKENARLKKELRRHPDKKEPEGGGLPEGIRGFRGMLVGVVATTTDRSLVVEVQKIGRTWRQSKAENPRVIVGKKVKIVIEPDRFSTDRWEQLVKQHLRVLGGLKTGDRVSVEAFHFGGGHLVVMEELREID